MSERTRRLREQIQEIDEQQNRVVSEIARRESANADAEQFLQGQMTALIGQLGMDNAQSNARIGDELQRINEKINATDHQLAELNKHLKDTAAIDDIYKLKKAECDRALADYKAECDRQMKEYREKCEGQTQKIQKSLYNLKKHRGKIVILFIVLTLVCMIGGAILGYKGISLLGF